MFKRTGIMIDLETLGLGPTAVVWQVGMHTFDLDTGSYKHSVWTEAFLPLQAVLDLGLDIDASTISWWMEQEDSAKEMFAKANVKHEGAAELKRRIYAIHDWIRNFVETSDDVEIWAQGPQFDIVKIEYIFNLFGLKTPVPYKQVRDLRTLRSVADVDKVNPDYLPSEPLVAHRAIDDCRKQIAVWRTCMEALGKL